MPEKIICDVLNCVYNEENNCDRKNIRVLTNTPEAKGSEGISCMSFRAEQIAEANTDPQQAEMNK